MQDFTLPANIKQIGSIGDGLRIYMEDYVCTFLQQYAETAGFEERIAFLVGKQMVIDGQQFLFIGGAIFGRYAEKVEGHLRFTEKSVDYAEETLEEFFPGMEIVGWMQSQPSYGTYLNQHYGAYHLRQFRRSYQVMFVIDPLERVNAFYAANPVAMTPADRMAEIPGYFIYYEKNTNMHEYMLVNKSTEYTAKSPTLVELTPVEYATGDETQSDDDESPVTGYDDYEKHNEGRFTFGATRNAQPEEIIRNREKTKARRRGNILEQKRAMNLVAGLCAVLFVVSFILGVGLIRNQDRLDNAEAQIRQLTMALRNHMAAEVEAVFAGDVPAYVADFPELPDTGILTPELPPAYEYTAQPTPVPAPTPAPPAPTPAPAPVQTPPPAAAEETAIVAPVPETYTIQPGDSLLAISLYFFGDANMMYAIMELNGFDNPDLIVAGRTIALPPR